jgi:integrin beta 3
LDLSCSVSGTPVANFTIQKEETVLSQYQNFSKIAEESDSGEYSCTAGIGKVVKRSGLVPIQVCGEYTLSCSDMQRLGRD